MTERRQRIPKFTAMELNEGTSFRFYCELSGAAVHTTGPVAAQTAEEALQTAWEKEGKASFNFCRKCGRWVSDVMFNADVCECVDCAPWEEMPNFCSHCGCRVSHKDVFCRKCGTRLQYGEVWT